MNKFMMRAAVMVTSLVLAGNVFGDTGWLNSYVFMWDGTSDTYYDLNGNDQTLDFHSEDLGTFDFASDILFLNAEINAFATGSDFYTEMRLHWRLNGGAWSVQTADSFTNPQLDDYRGIPAGVSIGELGLSNGIYTLDVYLSRTHEWGAGDSYTTYLTRNGDVGGGVNTGHTAPTDGFFTAELSVIPEPSSIIMMGLAGLAAGGLTVLKRRKRA